MVMIRAPELPLHTSGHSGKCRCHKKRGAPRAPGEDAREPTLPPPHRAEPEEKQNAESSREGMRRDANVLWKKQNNFEGGRAFEREGTFGWIGYFWV